MSVDPVTWVFPPAGAADITPGIATSSFGPVYPNDTVILNWTPSDQTPTVGLACFNSTGVYDDDVSVDAVSKGQLAPVSLNLNQRFATTEEDVYCHFVFHGTKNGNTVVWKFKKQQGSIASTWSESSTAPSSSYSGTPSTTQTNNTSSENTIPSPIGTGAAVGIGVAVTAFVFLAVLAGVLLLRRHRRQRCGQNTLPMPSTPAIVYEPIAQTPLYAELQTPETNNIGGPQQSDCAPLRELHNVSNTSIPELDTSIDRVPNIDSYKYRTN
ncbi:hypothetical protein BKA67DRAFT_660153 [Truncatella angustata]|uniref:Uncharacterized protein n=1 Tax=Truncatella angustata TaxID=152316 RepID=A0A9P8UKA6_9PEZI|nr:uncharacterized protein BKA67DRAFT_660153 [Truncatella angustata]KAH6653563.1 hypothetical protein BKA67DRAFT_660153 [Truncatella angustata]